MRLAFADSAITFPIPMEKLEPAFSQSRMQLGSSPDIALDRMGSKKCMAVYPKSSKRAA